MHSRYCCSVIYSQKFTFIQSILHYPLLQMDYLIFMSDGALMQKTAQDQYNFLKIASRLKSSLSCLILLTYTKVRGAFARFTLLGWLHEVMFQEHTTMWYSFYLLFTDPPAGWHPVSWQDVLWFLTSWGILQLVCNLIFFSTASWEYSGW